MRWDTLKNRKIRIVMCDGFVKYGTLLGEDDNFITIKYIRNDKTEWISIKNILTIGEYYD